MLLKGCVMLEPATRAPGEGGGGPFLSEITPGFCIAPAGVFLQWGKPRAQARRNHTAAEGPRRGFPRGRGFFPLEVDVRPAVPTGRVAAGQEVPGPPRGCPLPRLATQTTDRRQQRVQAVRGQRASSAVRFY